MKTGLYGPVFSFLPSPTRSLDPPIGLGGSEQPNGRGRPGFRRPGQVGARAPHFVHVARRRRIAEVRRAARRALLSGGRVFRGRNRKVVLPARGRIELGFLGRRQVDPDLLSQCPPSRRRSACPLFPRLPIIWTRQKRENISGRSTERNRNLGVRVALAYRVPMRGGPRRSALPFQVGPFSGLDEARPVEGVLAASAFQHGELSLAQSLAPPEALLQPGVVGGHHFPGNAVADGPETHDQGFGPRQEERAAEAVDPLTVLHFPDSRVAGGE